MKRTIVLFSDESNVPFTPLSIPITPFYNPSKNYGKSKMPYYW